MKFNIKPKPYLHDKKKVTRFAWFPIRVEDNIIWLEKFIVTYKYQKDSFWNYYYWQPYKKELINKSED